MVWRSQRSVLLRATANTIVCTRSTGVTCCQQQSSGGLLKWGVVCVKHARRQRRRHRRQRVDSRRAEAHQRRRPRASAPAPSTSASAGQTLPHTSASARSSCDVGIPPSWSSSCRLSVRTARAPGLPKQCPPRPGCTCGSWRVSVWWRRSGATGKGLCALFICIRGSSV